MEIIKKIKRLFKKKPKYYLAVTPRYVLWIIKADVIPDFVSLHDKIYFTCYIHNNKLYEIYLSSFQAKGYISLFNKDILKLY